jgi:hypothetical protein
VPQSGLNSDITADIEGEFVLADNAGNHRATVPGQEGPQSRSREAFRSFHDDETIPGFRRSHFPSPRRYPETDAWYECQCQQERSKKMRLMTITRLFAISVVLLGGTPAFAARAIHPDTRDICREQIAECRRSPFNVEIRSAISDAQAKANAASKTWPGGMIQG